MKKYFILFFTFLSAALWALEVFPAGKKYFYRTGEDIVFQINLDKGRENARFSIRIAGYEELNRTFTASADDKGAYQLRFQAEKPGFVFVEVKDNSKTAVAGAAVEPEKITAGRPCPPAFDTYWDNAKKELELMPLVYDIQEMPNATEGYRAFEVKVDMGGEGRDLFAVLTMPADAQPGRLAAEALFHGANTDKVSPVCRPETMVLSVNPMSVKHDGPMRTTTGKGKKFHGYYHWGVDDLEKNYFPNMFKRTFRALQFLKSLPEWDHRTLIVRGTSQGGGQALAAAGLDPQVTLCIAIVPALCDHGMAAEAVLQALFVVVAEVDDAVVGFHHLQRVLDGVAGGTAAVVSIQEVGIPGLDGLGFDVAGRGVQRALVVRGSLYADAIGQLTDFGRVLFISLSVLFPGGSLAYCSLRKGFGKGRGNQYKHQHGSECDNSHGLSHRHTPFQKNTCFFLSGLI